MKKGGVGMLFFYILVLLIVLVLLYFIVSYNRFIKLKNHIDEALSSIDVQLKRRYDLIPNLVEIVKGYAKHEKDTLEKVINARNIAINAKDFKEKAKAENILSETLKSIFALAESYPDLKANQNFLDLQKTLRDIEENIQFARRYYNAEVRDYNILCEAFPTNIIAQMFMFKKREFFEIPENERENVKITF